MMDGACLCGNPHHRHTSIRRQHAISWALIDKGLANHPEFAEIVTSVYEAVTGVQPLIPENWYETATFPKDRYIMVERENEYGMLTYWDGSFS